MTTLQKALVGTALVAAIGAGILEAHRASQLREQNQALQQQQAPLAAQIQQLQQERNDATNRLAALQARLAVVPQNNTELLKLRSESTQLRQDSNELAQMKSARKDKAAAQAGFMNFVISQMGTGMTNAALHKVNDLRDKLKLTADQEQQLRALLMNLTETQVQAASSSVTGNLTDDARQQLKQLRADEESQILAMLTPDQQIAYQNLQKQEAAESIQFFAKRESSEMQAQLQLSADQAQAVYSILASLPTGQGGISDATAPNAKEQLNLRLQALAQTLTPDQLAAYQQSKLTEIQQANAALQMFKSVAQ